MNEPRYCPVCGADLYYGQCAQCTEYERLERERMAANKMTPQPSGEVPGWAHHPYVHGRAEADIVIDRLIQAVAIAWEALDWYSLQGKLKDGSTVTVDASIAKDAMRRIEELGK